MPVKELKPGSRLRRPYPRRLAIQLLTLAIILGIGFQFANWVAHLEAGRIAGVRPPGVEGFLPIAGLISLKHWLVSGEFSMIHPAGLVILLLILATGLLLKKAFCSWLCPVGAASEGLARLSQRVFGRKLHLPRWLDLPLMSLKYLLLAFFLHAIFVRMSGPILAQFLQSPYNRVADIKMLHFFTHMSSLTMQVLAGLVVLSFVLPYFWCRYLCPYGGLLGALSWLSPLKLRRTASACIDCGRCAEVCPSFIPVDRLATVTSPECTACLECVVHCPQPDALALTTPRWGRRAVPPPVFAALVVAVFFGGIGVAKLAGRWESQISHEELRDRVQRGLDGPEYGHFGR
jgi:polyferredoxin